ncbi:MAG: DUF2851 family protein [Bacteroidia bacterium]
MHVNQREIPESFLHFVWRGRYLHPGRRLIATCGKTVEVLHPGYWNHDQGPDFLQARLRIDGILWQGHVEIHVQSGDWYAHRHHTDKGYNGVVLHVAMNPGSKAVIRQDGTAIPEIAVAQHIPEDLYSAYHRLMLHEASLACEGQWNRVSDLVKKSWFTRLSMERMERASVRLNHKLLNTAGDWNQAIWEALAAYLAGPVNKEAFIQIAEQIPARLLNAYKSNFIQQEALLMGAAGLLQTKTPLQDPYYQRLRSEWQHLSHKHSLSGIPVFPLKFHRMRPASFPTIRLSQLAAISRHWPVLTSLLVQEGITEFLQIPIFASQYWNEHYVFGSKKPSCSKTLGRNQKEALIINTFAPLGLLYQRAHGSPDASSWLDNVLSNLAPENNRHTRLFMKMGFSPSNAIYSQGMIECYTQYCLERRCLDCAIGACLLGKKITTLKK